MSQNTKQKIALYLETIGVPNPERLNSKNEEFLFDLGVYIVSPLVEDESIKELREQMDFLLNYESFDKASDELEKRNKDKNKFENGAMGRFLSEVVNGNLGNGVKVQVIDLSGRRGNYRDGMTEEDFKKRKEIASLISGNQKISELMAIAHKLGKGQDAVKNYDRLSDLDKHYNDYFNEVYVFLTDLMTDDHYKTCGCVAKKFDTFVYANSRESALSNWGGG